MHKIVRSILVGLLGSTLFPLSFYVLLLLGMLYEHNGLTGIAPDVSDGWGGLSYVFWTIILLPIIVCIIGAITLKVNFREGLGKYDVLLLPEISGIIASLLGFVLYVFTSGLILPFANWEVVIHSRIPVLKYYLAYSLPFLIFWSLCAPAGILFYNRFPSLDALRKGIKILPLKTILLILSAIVVISAIGFYIFGTSGSARIMDAYCDNNGHFNFTVVNDEPSSASLTYKWHLDDPKAGKPRPIWNNGWTSDYYAGSGNVTISEKRGQAVVVPIPLDASYPQNNLVMDVELFEGNMSVCHYREQKSPSQWDYSSLPPKPL